MQKISPYVVFTDALVLDCSPVVLIINICNRSDFDLSRLVLIAKKKQEMERETNPESTTDFEFLTKTIFHKHLGVCFCGVSRCVQLLARQFLLVYGCIEADFCE